MIFASLAVVWLLLRFHIVALVQAVFEMPDDILHRMIRDSLFEGTRLMLVWRDIIYEGEKAEGVAPDCFIDLEHVVHRASLLEHDRDFRPVVQITSAFDVENICEFLPLDETLFRMDEHRKALTEHAIVAYLLLASQKYSIVIGSRHRFLSWDSHVVSPQQLADCATYVPGRNSVWI